MNGMYLMDTIQNLVSGNEPRNTSALHFWFLRFLCSVLGKERRPPPKFTMIHLPLITCVFAVSLRIMASPISQADPDTIGGITPSNLTTNATTFQGLPDRPPDPFSVRELDEWTTFSSYREPSFSIEEISQFQVEFSIFLNLLMESQSLMLQDTIPIRPLEVELLSQPSVIPIDVLIADTFHSTKGE